MVLFIVLDKKQADPHIVDEDGLNVKAKLINV